MVPTGDAVVSFSCEDGAVLEGGPEAILEEAEEVVLRWDPSDAHSSDSYIWDSAAASASASASAAAAEYISAVDALFAVASAPSSSSSSSSSPLRGRAESALRIAMARLEREFHGLLVRSTLPVPALHLRFGPFPSIFPASASASFTSSFDDSLTSSAPATPLDDLRSRTLQDLARPHEAGADLTEIADRIIRAGYGPELQLLYAAVRHDFVGKTLAALDVGGAGTGVEVLMIDWAILNSKVRRWIHALNVLVKLLLPGEQRICDPEQFAQTAENGISQLFSFVDGIVALAESRHSPEKLFAVLEIHEALSDIAPALDALFLGEVRDLMAETVKATLNRLGEAARGSIAEFRDSVRWHAPVKLSPGGGTHPLTQDVISYARILVHYSDPLNLLLDEGVAGSGDDNTTPLGNCVRSLLASLESNIEEKSELYEDGGLKSIFLMNNVHYIVKSVSFTELNALLGDDWIRERHGQIGQYAHSYLRASWAKVLSCLKYVGLRGSRSFYALSRVLRERLKKFNSDFEKICRVQAAWVVPDPELREELRIAAVHHVVSVYRSFVKRFQFQVGRGHQADIKWTPEDVEDCLLDLFEGLREAPNRPRRKRTS